MAAHNELGQWGEQLARTHLLAQGYAVMGENIRIGSVEIDFIATKDNRICFVEVKTRTTDEVDPLDAINKRKRSRMVRAADSFMQAAAVTLEPQFDLIFVIGTPDNYTVEHIPDAFIAEIDNNF